MRAIALIVLQLCVCRAALAVSAYEPTAAPLEIELIRWDRLGAMQHRRGTCLAQAGDKSVWIGSVESIFRYDGYELTQFNLHDIGLHSEPIAIASTGDEVWVASEHDLGHWDGNRWRAVSLGPIQGCWLRDLAFLNGRLWVAYRGGLAYVDRGEVIPISVPQRPWDPYQMVVDEARGRIWLTLKGGNVAQLQLAGDPSQPVCRVYGREDGLKFAGRAFVQCDSAGSVWVVSRQGGGVFRCTDGVWSFISIEGMRKANGVLAHSNGSLWMVDGDDLWIVSDEQIQRKRYWWLDAGHRVSLLEARGGVVWAASGAELRSCELASNRWRRFRGIRFHGVDDLQRSWFLSDGDRVVAEERGRWTSYGAEDGIRGNPLSLQIFPSSGPLVISADGPELITQNLNGVGWKARSHGQLELLRTQHAGGVTPLVFAENECKETIVLRIAEEGWQQQPLSIRPSAVTETRDGSVWVLEANAGLLLLRDSQLEKVPFEPVAAADVRSIYVDFQDRLWVLTTNGDVYMRNDGSWSSIGRTAPSRPGGGTRLFQDGTGAILGGQLCYYRLGGEMLRSPLPKAIKQSVVQGAGDGTLWFDGALRRRCDRDPPIVSISSSTTQEDGSVLVTWSGHDRWYGTRSDDLHYSWRINNGNWTPYHHQSQATLRLGGGTHAFQIRARDADRNVSSVVTRKVRLPIVFWKSNWFRALLALMIGGIVVQSVRLGRRASQLNDVNRELSQSREKLRKLVTQRTSELQHALMERDELNQELSHAQRLDALGNLAAGVAHDFNNYLTAVTGFASLALEATTLDGKQSYIEQIELVTKQAASLTRSLANFSHKSQTRQIPILLREYLYETLETLRQLVPAKVVIRLQANSPFFVLADSSQLTQVFINLVVNARDAMPNGGIIQISMSDSLEDGCVLLTVSDTGAGIPPHIRKRAFEPFFTTKSRGMGTGLGLAQVRTIIRNHRGTIGIQSGSLVGTTIEIRLPLAEEECDQSPSQERSTSGRAAGETVMIVEDHRPVREALATILETTGYCVVAAECGKTAQQLFQERQTTIDAVVLDIDLPGVSGIQLSQEFLKSRPDLPILVASGAPESIQVGQRDLTRIVPKPYRPEDVVKALAELIATESTACMGAVD